MLGPIRKWLRSRERRKRALLRSLVNRDQQPNLDLLSVAVHDLSITNMNIKAFGYDLARRLKSALPIPEGTVARKIGLACKASIQADIESDWVAHWCGQLQTPVIYHRKLWELSYVLQAIFEEGHLEAGRRGLGFGCGIEVIPSYLASHGVAVTVTDLPGENAQALGWAATDQHATSLERAYHANLVERDRFDALVRLRYVDMNAIPDDLGDYDFCWSVCALEHLGSIERGLTFIEQSLRTVRPGGLSVHTTELNINDEGPTVDNWPTVLFQRRHFEALATRLRAQGHYVAEMDFDFGDKPMDRFIDIPPWTHDMPENLRKWFGQPYHLKVSADGVPCTCFGIIVRKAPGEPIAP